MGTDPEMHKVFWLDLDPQKRIQFHNTDKNMEYH
jgi:hypothetical protein